MRYLADELTIHLTDWGGIQEEASGLRVPALVLRDTTERPEGVETGVVRLVGTRRNHIVTEAAKLLNDPVAHAAMSAGVNPYGDGKAANRIVSILLERHHKPVSGWDQFGRDSSLRDGQRVLCDPQYGVDPATTRSASTT